LEAEFQAPNNVSSDRHQKPQIFASPIATNDDVQVATNIYYSAYLPSWLHEARTGRATVRDLDADNDGSAISPSRCSLR
jgi:hypothetical protein